MPSSFEIRILLLILIKKRVSARFWTNSLRRKAYANHLDAQSQGWRRGAWTKTVDGRAGQSRTSRELSIDQERRLQERSKKTHRSRSEERRVGKECKYRKWRWTDKK